METVTHREMRNNSGEILRRVDAGEFIGVTSKGRIATLIVPSATDALAEAAKRGQQRAPRRDVTALRTLRRRVPQRTSEQIIADSRGRC